MRKNTILASVVVIALHAIALTAQTTNCVSFPIPNALDRVVYGSGTFVAVGENGTIITSTDGLNWFMRRQEDGDNLFAVQYANGMFVVAGGFAGTILTSADGNNWVRQQLGGTDRLFGIAYGDGTWVVVGDSAILTSTNAAAWERKLAARTLWDVTYGAGTFLAVGDRGLILSSADGALWARQNSDTGDFLDAVEFLGNQFVAVGQSGAVYTSNEGTAWFRHETPGRPGDPGLLGLAYGNGLYIAVGYEGTILTSSDGVMWTQLKSGVDSYVTDVCFGNGMFVAVGGGLGSTGGYSTLLTSTNGTDWRVLSGPVKPSLRMAFGASNRVLLQLSSSAGMSATLQRSTNLLDWSDWFWPVFDTNQMTFRVPVDDRTAQEFYRLVVP